MYFNTFILQLEGEYMTAGSDFLNKDKYKLLEGICVENQFKKSFTFQTSEGWWCVPKNYEKTHFIFFYLLLPNQSITEITLKVFEHLLSYKQTIYISVYNNEDFYFKKIEQLTDLNNENYFNIDVLMRKENINLKYQNFQASSSTTDLFKTQRVIQYFTDENILEKVKVERVFANHILSGHLNTMPINLDNIMFRNNSLIVIEIKFKYPSKQNTFGINIGQARVLNYLIQIGFKVFHYIAINPSYNESIGIFEIQHNSYLKENLFWYYKELLITDFQTNFSVAPSKTSIDGNSRQKFINLNASSFKIQLVQQQPLKVAHLENLYELPPCKGCGGEQKIAKHNNNNIFSLGCVNYH